MWNLRYHEDGWSLQQYERATRGYGKVGRLPEWYLQRPQEHRGDEFYLSAFARLGTCRQFPGTGFGPIPWTAAREYAIEHGLGPSMRVVFCDVILLLDSAYREHMRKRIEEDEKRRQDDEKRSQKEAEARAAAGAGGGRRRK